MLQVLSHLYICQILHQSGPVDQSVISYNLYGVTMNQDVHVEEESSVKEGKEKNNKEPTGRHGVCSFVYNNNFYLYGGRSFERSTIKLDVLDLTSGCWVTKITTGEAPDRSLFGACCTVTNGCLYLFGGILGFSRNANVYELNLNTLTWRNLPARNQREGPMGKDKTGIVTYGKHMLCVFGGYGDLDEDGMIRQSGATYDGPDPENWAGMYWTNELHLFHIPTRMYACN